MPNLNELREYDKNEELLLENIQDNDWIDADVFFDLLEREVDSWYE